MEIIVWSKRDTACGYCKATIRCLERKRIPHRVNYFEDHPEKAEEFRCQGLLQAPIVITPDQQWSGFRPDLLEELCQNYLQLVPESV